VWAEEGGEGRKAYREEGVPYRLSAFRSEHIMKLIPAIAALGIIAWLLPAVVGAADPAAQPDAEPPIHLAARQGNLDEVKALVQGDPDLVSSKDIGGWTPLHQAAFAGHKEVAQFLLDHNADVNARDNYDVTPLSVASFTGRTDVVELLLAHKAEVNCKDKNGWTPLHNVQGNNEIAELLLKNHADVTAKAQDGQTPLDVAMARNHQDVAELIRKYGGKSEQSPEQAINEAAKEGDLGRIKSLLDSNPRLVDGRDSQGNTPLHWAAKVNSKDAVALLVSDKADVNAKDDRGTTPLGIAVTQGNKAVVELLLANKAAVDAKDDQGYTPLHLAAFSGSKDLVDLLIKNNADVNAKSNGGTTPLHAGAAFKDVEELLIANKADVNAKDNRGHTPLHLAVLGRHTESADFLWQHGGTDVPATEPATMEPVKFRQPDWIRSATHLHVIGIALMQYVKENGSYPAHLSDLRSEEVTADMLTCPIDGKPYVYSKPTASDAPPHTVVAYEGSPPKSRDMINILCADGDVEGFRTVDAKAIITCGHR